MRTVIFKGKAKGERAVHSSVRLPAEIHAYAKDRGINLSRTLAATLAAARDEEEGGTGVPATTLAPVPIGPTTHRENHGDTSQLRRRG